MNLNFYAEQVKERLNTREVLTHYGVTPNKKGFVCCPFHNEKTPSMKVYKDKGGFHCFGCGAHGSVIDFVMMFFDLPFKDAVEKLSDDFFLGLPLKENLTKSQKLEMSKKAFAFSQKRKKEKEERERLQENYNQALAEWILLDKMKTKYTPNGKTDKLHPCFLEAIMNMPYAEYKLEQAEKELTEYETRNRCCS